MEIWRMLITCKTWRQAGGQANTLVKVLRFKDCEKSFLVSKSKYLQKCHKSDRGTGHHRQSHVLGESWRVTWQTKRSLTCDKLSPCPWCMMLSDDDHCCTLVTGAVVLLSLSQAAVDTLLLSPVLCSSPTLQLTADSRLTLSCRGGLSRRCRQSLARPAALCLRNEQSPVTRQQLGTQPAASLSWASVARCDDRRQSWSGSQQAASLQNYPSAA